MYSGANVLEEVVQEDIIRAAAMPVQRADLAYAPISHSLAPASRRSWYLPVKTAGEWLIALILIVLTAPLMLVLGALVKLTSRGPMFYAQARLGRNGRTFQMYKLRTMVHNAEARTGPIWATRDDSRVTRYGKILRHTHLDELPQLWNILKGEMGLIGPRPERPEIAARIERRLPAFRQRLCVRPGVTGLAQMRLPADDPEDVAMESVRRKLAHDLFYAREVSLLLDLRIAISTPCYFIAAALDGLHRRLVRSYGLAAERELVVTPKCEGEERAA